MSRDRRQRPFPRPPDDRRAGDDRRRTTWREFRASYPGVLVTMGLALAVMLGASAYLLHKRSAYAAETARLRANMSEVERERTDLILASDDRRFQMMLELLRRQARADQQLNMAVAVDSGRLFLQREGRVLREMDVRIGAGRTVGTPPDTVRLAAPRGKRTVERVLGAKDVWEVPAWVYEERGLPVPEDRSTPGALGAHAVILNGGLVLYTLPASGPLADSGYVLPGSVRLDEADLAAVVPNLRPGVGIYFY